MYKETILIPSAQVIDAMKLNLADALNQNSSYNFPIEIIDVKWTMEGLKIWIQERSESG